MQRAWILIALTATLALTWVSPAFAQATPSLDDLDEEQQRQLANLYDLAESNAERGEWRKSLNYFKDAYDLFPHPRLIYQMARCHDKLGEEAAALNAYQRFVSDLPDAAEVPEAKRRIEALRAKKTREATSLRIKSTPPGAVVYIDDIANGAVGTTPTIDLPLNEGTYTVIVELDGYLTSERLVELEPGASRIESFSLEKDPAGAPDPGTSRPGGPGPGAAPITLAVVGGLGLASAVTFGLLWNGVSDPEACSAQGCTIEERNLYETMTYVSGGVAIIGLAGAIILWNSSGQLGANPQDTTPRVGAWATGDGGGLTVQGRF